MEIPIPLTGPIKTELNMVDNAKGCSTLNALEGSRGMYGHTLARYLLTRELHNFYQPMEYIEDLCLGEAMHEVANARLLC